MSRSTATDDHENAIHTRRRSLAYRLITRIDQIARHGDLGMLNYPPCGSRNHPWLPFQVEHRRLREIAGKPNPSRADLRELLDRTQCNSARARDACRRLPANTQFSRAAHKHRQRLSSLARAAAQYSDLFPT